MVERVTLTHSPYEQRYEVKTRVPSVVSSQGYDTGVLRRTVSQGPLFMLGKLYDRDQVGLAEENLCPVDFVSLPFPEGF